MASRFRMCDRAGEMMAPPTFITALRQETQDADLTCWWDVGVQCVDHTFGAWVIWKEIPVAQHMGNPSLTLVARKFVDVYKLDGNYQRPRTLGTWVFEVLNESNEQLSRNHDRRRHVDDLIEGQAVKDEKDLDDMCAYLGKDPALRHVYQKIDDQLGAVLTTKEERIANRRWMERKDELQTEQAMDDAKDLRMYTR